MFANLFKSIHGVDASKCVHSSSRTTKTFQSVTPKYAFDQRTFAEAKGKKVKKDETKKKGRKFDLLKMWKTGPAIPKVAAKDVPQWFREWVWKLEAGDTSNDWSHMKKLQHLEDVSDPRDVLRYARRMKKDLIKQNNLMRAKE